MKIEKLIKKEANEKTPELFSEILNKAGEEGLIPQSEIEKFNVPKKSVGNKGFVISTVAAVTALAVGLGIGVPLGLNSEGAVPPSGSDNGAVASHEHVFGEWNIITNKSCDKDGLKERACACGEKEQEVIPMSHSYSYSFDYNEHWQVCSECQAVTEKEEHVIGRWSDCNTCSYHENLKPFSDTSLMHFSLVNHEFWSLDGIDFELWEFLNPRDVELYTTLQVVVPEYYQSPLEPELGTLPVSMIGHDAFKGESRIRSVVLPSTIKYIASEAFADMPSLTRAYIPEGVTHIGSQAFARCERLKEVQLPSTLESSIGLAEDAFDFSGIETLRISPMNYGDYNDLLFVNLNYYNMPSLNRIETYDNVFFDFKNNALYFQNSAREIGVVQNIHLVTFIGDGSDIDLTTGYNTVGDSAFRNKQLANTDLYLPTELVFIRENAFNNCNVKTIHIGANFANKCTGYIGADAFTYANDLTDIYFEGTKQRWEFLATYTSFHSGVVVHCTDGDIVY